MSVFAHSDAAEDPGAFLKHWLVSGKVTIENLWRVQSLGRFCWQVLSKPLSTVFWNSESTCRPFQVHFNLQALWLHSQVASWIRNWPLDRRASWWPCHHHKTLRLLVAQSRLFVFGLPGSFSGDLGPLLKLYIHMEVYKFRGVDVLPPLTKIMDPHPTLEQISRFCRGLGTSTFSGRI